MIVEAVLGDSEQVRPEAVDGDTVATCHAIEKGLLDQVLDVVPELCSKKPTDRIEVPADELVAGGAVATPPGLEKIAVAAHLRAIAPTAVAEDLHAQAMLARIRSALVDADAEPVRVGRFEIVRVLGRGGMGVVYEARDPTLGRLVALKVVDATAEERPRVLQEARALARLQHPAIVQVHEADVDGDRVYIAMEHIAGTRLDQWIENARPSLAETLRVYRTAGEALAAAHDKHVIHGDFKPANVLVAETGEVKVVDFGLARIDRIRTELRARTVSHGASPGLTAAGAGTPGYMAPEQITGERVDERTDQFAFCVALFEALTGRRPFFGATPLEIAQRALRGEIDEAALATVPPHLRATMRRGLSHLPTERFPSMRALVATLVPVRRRWPYAAAAIVVIAGGLVTWQVASRSSTTPEARPDANAEVKADVKAPVVQPVTTPAPAPVVDVRPAPEPATRPTSKPAAPRKATPAANATSTTVTPMAAPSPPPPRRVPTTATPADRIPDQDSPEMLASVEVWNAEKAERAGNAEACLRILDHALQIDPKTGNDGRIAVITRARCEMRLGRCEQGKQRLAALDGNTQWALDDAARLADVLCPVVDGALDTRLERLRVQARSDKLCAQTSVLAGAMTAFGERASMSEAQAKKLSSILGSVSVCFARALQCDGATRARSAYLQVAAKQSATAAAAAAADWASVQCTDSARRAEEEADKRRDDFFKQNEHRSP